MRPGISKTNWFRASVYVFSVALLMYLVAATTYGKEINAEMTFSGTGAFASPINLQHPNSTTIEENVAGNGNLGRFTLRNITADDNSPSADPPSSCSGKTLLFFPRVAGAAILRFKDGSLLNLTLISGGDCIDLSSSQGHCTLTLQVKGGTGRFKNASGVLAYTETALTVLSDDYGNPVFFDETGELKGTISGVDLGDDDHGDGK